MVATASLMILFRNLRDKWINVVRYEALCKNERYNLLTELCAVTLIVEVMALFVVAVINMICKLA